MTPVVSFSGIDGNSVFGKDAPVVFPARETLEVVGAYGEDEFVAGFGGFEGVEGAYGIVRRSHAEFDFIDLGLGQFPVPCQSRAGGFGALRAFRSSGPLLEGAHRRDDKVHFVHPLRLAKGAENGQVPFVHRVETTAVYSYLHNG